MNERAAEDGSLQRVLHVGALRARAGLQDGDWIETAGFHTPGDGGGALYRICAGADLQPNGADIIGLDGDLAAVLEESQAVNYRMFGALGHGVQDDGVQIKHAHEYANRRRIPVVNRSGEFWIRQTNNIPITTNVDWGQTTIHIDERFNDKQAPRFVVLNDRPTRTLELDAATKATLLERIRPGVQLIPELAALAGHLITIVDEGDRIGIRAGNYGKRGWAREELFYVEEEGRIIGDIAWAFRDFTSVTATPCNDNYLIIEGGGFYFSGDTPEGSSPGYHHHGFAVQRSRTIIRQQWMGLERGRADTSLEPRKGFYALSGVYDVTLENIRCMPWEKNRVEPATPVLHGTYGIGGARMLACTFRNLTAEAGWVAWGVFGTNLNKDFRIEGCRLNRIDVHFHCWNLYIRDCTIGFKGISVTGGGDLFIDNTTRHGNVFVNFRRDYGAKWDGDIRLRGCTLKPSGAGTAAVLSYRPDDFDYRYPIGFGRSVQIEDLVVDYAAAPESQDPCWLMDIVPFSQTSDGVRLRFPHRLVFRHITVEGRAEGVRLARILDPGRYRLQRDGGCDDSHLDANATIVCDDVQLERLTQIADADVAHLAIGGPEPVEYADSRALYPKIRFTDCDDVTVYLGHCVAAATFQRCTVSTVTAPALRGELAFTECRLQPRVKAASGPFYTVTSTTRFTSCTIHAPVVDDEADPALVDRLGLLEINRVVRHSHLHTRLGREILSHLEGQGVSLDASFLAQLQSRCDPGG